MLSLFLYIFQCEVLAALRGTGGGSCYLSGRFQRAILAALCGAESIDREMACLCFIKRWLFVDLCQSKVGGLYDKQMSGKEV